MIHFFYDKQSTYRRIWNISMILFKKFLIIGVICFGLGAFFHPTGYNYQILEFIFIGAILLFAGATFIMMFIVACRPFYQQITSTYKNHAKDGLLHYCLFVRDSKYILKCEESEQEVEFSREDIKKIIRQNGTIIVELFTDRVLDFPDREDIYCLFENQSL